MLNKHSICYCYYYQSFSDCLPIYYLMGCLTFMNNYENMDIESKSQDFNCFPVLI